VIRAIVFDFGRVISAQKPESLFRGYEDDLGLAPGSINEIMFQSRAWQETLEGRRSDEAFWLAVGPALGLRTREAVLAFRARYRADEKVNPEVEALIRRLRGRYRLAVLSNAPAGLAGWLLDWGMIDCFQVVFCSGDEGVAKPDPVAFEMTLDRLGVKARETVFIDDASENVESARRLGIHGILFTDCQSLTAELSIVLGPGALDR
jgi:epoxide hydrolase-like predicted phosphatase